MSLEYCPTCRELMLFPERHKCKPAWLVIEAENYEFMKEENELGDAIVEGQKIFARDEQKAAEEFLDRNYSDFDYPDDLRVYVFKHDPEKAKLFIVTAEQTVVFHAEEEEIPQ